VARDGIQLYKSPFVVVSIIKLDSSSAAFSDPGIDTMILELRLLSK